MTSYRGIDSRGPQGAEGRIRGLWRLAAGLLPMLIGMAAPLPAQAQVEQVTLGVMVSHISDQPGKIDPRGQRIHEKLSAQIRYQSLSVLQSDSLRLGLNEVGTVDLPNSRTLRVRPTDVSERGVLLNVDVEGSVQTDLRVKNGHLVVFGTEPWKQGKIVISLEPTW